ncbi:MAG: U32 family peptidase [Desulfobacterota bacterium]|nr:U32 family peptidase [Thermodesulfobacteriota bacterium]
MGSDGPKRIELLAPAGTADAGMAAINCGADAVYIGPERFGAREAAGNSIADIEKLCTYAHRYWARVYATVNTILRDDELIHARALIQKLYEAGVDGLIIQDTGLLELDLPPLPLIASTQMHNESPEKVAFLEAVGFSRVILARELTLADIRRIRAATRIELECFVHGALCVSYSGRCFMSYAIGGRSANRGQCAQPCRRLYRLENEDGKLVAGPAYLLSLKDLNLSSYLNELIGAGVTAFKIEGRLKDIAYVVNITSLYRKKLDALLNGTTLHKSSSGTTVFFFEPDPVKTFNRGFTASFLKDRPHALASLKSPTWVGEYIGTVVGVSRQGFTLGQSHDLHNGDGICFFDMHNRLFGTVVNGVAGNTVIPDKMQGIVPGIAVYRNHDHRFLRRLNGNAASRHISVRFELAETVDGFEIRARDEDGNCALFRYRGEKKPAAKKNAALATIIRQLRKLGGTDFYCTDVSVLTSTVYFIPVRVLNSLRRGVIAELAAQRHKNRPVKTGGAVRNTVPYPYQEITYEENVLNKKAVAFYRRHGVVSIEPAVESGLPVHGKRVMRTKYCIRYELGWCGNKKEPPPGDTILYLVDEEGRHFRLGFDCSVCCMEVYAP